MPKRELEVCLNHVELELDRVKSRVGGTPGYPDDLLLLFTLGHALLSFRARLVDARLHGIERLKTEFFSENPDLLLLLGRLEDTELLRVIREFRDRIYDSTTF